MSGSPPLGIFRINVAPNPLNPLAFDLLWPQIAGKEYQVQSSTDLLAATWAPVGLPFTGTATSVPFTTPPRSPATLREFYRALVIDTDEDGDGLSHAEESAIGTDPTSADSDGDGSLDKDELIQGSSPTQSSDGGQPPFVATFPPPPLKLRLFTYASLGVSYPSSTALLTPYTLRIYEQNIATGAETQVHSATYNGSSLYYSENFELPNLVTDSNKRYSVQIDLPTIGTAVFDQPYRDWSFFVSLTPNAGSASFTAINGFNPATQQFGSTGAILGGSKIFNPSYENYRAIITPVTLGEISFSGAKYQPLKSDDLSTDYTAPQWKVLEPGDLQTPGFPINFAAGARNYSLAYTSGSMPVVSAKLSFLNGSGVGQTYKVRANGSDGIVIPEAALVPGSAGELIMPTTTSSTAWAANKVKFYDKSQKTTAFTLNWEMSVNNGIWVKLATTYHQVYITLADSALVTATSDDPTAVPLPGNLETAFYLACHNPSGKSNPDEIVSLIYGEFQDRRIQLVNKITGLPSGESLNYYGKFPRSSFGNRSWHLLVSGHTVCGGWAKFLVDLIALHGIVATKQDIGTSNVASTSVNAVSSICRGFVLKPLVIPASGYTTDSDADPLFRYSGGNKILIPAQGRGDQRQDWPSHSITKYVSSAQGEIYFDPSYGTTPSNGQAAYRASLAGFYGDQPRYFGLPPIEIRWWPVDPTHDDLIFK